MEPFWELAVRLGAPVFNLLLPGSRIFLPYLAGAFLIAFFVYLARVAEMPGPAAGVRHRFLEFCFARRIYAHRSALVDYRFYAANSLLKAFGLAPVLVGVPLVADATAGGLAALAPAAPLAQGAASAGPAADAAAGIAVGPSAQFGYTLALLIAFDGGLFVAHYLQHRVPVLWEFHKVHHSAQVLTPITLYRMHPVDDGTCTALAMGAVAGAFNWQYGGTVAEFLVAGLNPGLFLFYLLGYNLRHSHIWLAYPRWLSGLLISPAQHQIHHSSAPVHFNKNLGFIFSFWDRMAGTLHVPTKPESIAFGLGGGQDDQYDGVIALYVLPFRKAARRMLGAAPRRRSSRRA